MSTNQAMPLLQPNKRYRLVAWRRGEAYTGPATPPLWHSESVSALEFGFVETDKRNPGGFGPVLSYGPGPLGQIPPPPPGSPPLPPTPPPPPSYPPPASETSDMDVESVDRAPSPGDTRVTNVHGATVRPATTPHPRNGARRAGDAGRSNEEEGKGFAARVQHEREVHRKGCMRENVENPRLIIDAIAARVDAKMAKLSRVDAVRADRERIAFCIKYGMAEW